MKHRLRVAQGAAAAGFTLFELVIAIVILSVVAAIAVPKFLDMRSAARASVIKTFAASALGNMDAAIAIWRIRGGTPVTMDGKSIDLNVSGTDAMGVLVPAGS